MRLPGEVADALREHRRRQVAERLELGPGWSDRDYVFTNRRGDPLAARVVTAEFHRAIAAAGLPHRRWHDLRHAYATLLLEDGEELGVIPRTLGHSQISTTADIYAHLTPAMLERMAARMDGVLTRRRRVAGA